VKNIGAINFTHPFHASLPEVSFLIQVAPNCNHLKSLLIIWIHFSFIKTSRNHSPLNWFIDNFVGSDIFRWEQQIVVLWRIFMKCFDRYCQDSTFRFSATTILSYNIEYLACWHKSGIIKDSLTTEESRNWKFFLLRRECVYGKYNQKLSGKWWTTLSLL